MTRDEFEDHIVAGDDDELLYVFDRQAALIAQLLEALKEVDGWGSDWWIHSGNKVRAAIRAAEETK